MTTTKSSIKKFKGISVATAALAFCLIFSSCNKDSTTTPSTTLSDDEVATAVTESVSDSSGGMVTQTQASATMASTSDLSCGESSDTTINGQNISGAIVTYNYNLQFSRSLVCNNGIPSQFNFNFTGSSSYTAPLMSSNDNSNAQFVITGLQPTDANWVLNENYVRNGTQQSKVNLKRSFSSTITVTSSNVTVSKSTEKIISGTATVQFSGAISGGAGVTRGATVVFLGNGQASLTLDNGNAYTIIW